MNRRSGFTFIELLLVLGILSVLGGIAAVGTGVARERSAVATMRSDLQSYVEAEQYRWREVSQYGGAAALQNENRFDLSAGVVMDSAWVDAAERDRVYLRVRHRQSDQLCSVDFSPNSERATNRIRCFDPGMERLAQADVPSERSDTMLMGARPVEPVAPPPDPDALVAPTVVAGSNHMALPGTTFSRTFEVRNNSPVARTYAFSAASSNAGVVPVPGNPSPQTIPAGGSISIPISYSVAGGATEGAFAVLPLQASDTQEPALSGQDDFTVSTLLVLGNPAVTGSVSSPVDSGVPFFAEFEVRTTSNGPRMFGIRGSQTGGPPALRLLSDAGIGDFPFDPFERRAVEMEHMLDPEAEGGSTYTVSLEVQDNGDPTYRAAAHLEVQARLLLRDPIVTAPEDMERFPGVGFMPADGEAFTVRWSFVNQSNAQREFRVEPLIAPGADLVLVEPAGATNVMVPKRAAHEFDVSYRIRGGSISAKRSQAILRITDVGDPSCAAEKGSECSATAFFDVYTGTVAQNPIFEIASRDTAAVQQQRFSRTWQVRNPTNADVVLDVLSSLSPGSALEVVGGEGPISFGPFEQRTVQVEYQVRSGRDAIPETTHGVVLQVVDRERPSVRSSHEWVFTVLNRPPVPAFDWSYSNGIMPQSGEVVTFEASESSDPDSDAPLTCAIDFGDGSPGWQGDCSETVEHTFARGGTYSVRLTVDDGHSASNSAEITREIEVNSVPDANYDYSPRTPWGPQVGGVADFSSTSTDEDGDGLTCSWDFGNGMTGTGCAVPVTFIRGGVTPTVTLTVTDGRGGVGSHQKGIYVNTQPVAAGWSYSPQNWPQAGSSVAFHANASDSDGDPFTCAWDFGDGTTSSDCIAEKTWSTGGDKNVTLTVSDGRGPDVSHSRNVYVNTPPTVNFGFTPAIPQVGQSVSFTSGSADVDGHSLSCTWSGAVTGTGCQLSRSFSTGGSKAVTLTVTDGFGGTKSVTRSVPVNTPPVASFSFTPARPNEGSAASFTSTSSDADGDALTCTWNFSDGSTANGCSISKTFASGGSRSARLTVSDARGGSAEATRTFSVNRRPSATLSGPSSAYTGDNVCFTLSGTDPDGDALSYSPGKSWCTSWPTGGRKSVTGTVCDAGLCVSKTAYVEVAVKVLGCTNSAANNYNPNATHDNGTCSYNRPPTIAVSCQEEAVVGTNYRCDANVSDPDGDAITVNWSGGGTGLSRSFSAGTTAGVTHQRCATASDGRGGSASHCGNVLVIPRLGCTDSRASNYEPEATRDNGSCVYNWAVDRGAPHTGEPSDVRFIHGDLTCYIGSADTPYPGGAAGHRVTVRSESAHPNEQVTVSFNGCTASGAGSASCSEKVAAMPGMRTRYSWSATRKPLNNPTATETRSGSFDAYGCTIGYRDPDDPSGRLCTMCTPGCNVGVVTGCG